MEERFQSAEKPAKKTYHAPVMVRFGDFRNLTLGGGPRSLADGGSRTTKTGG